MKTTIYFCLSFLLTAINATAQIAEKAEDISPLLISEKIPSVNIINANGKTESILDVIKRKPTILLFYRGGWCLYCNAHLSAVGQIEKEISELGYQIVAVSPDSPKNLMKSSEKNKTNYALYSDSKGELTITMGLAFKASEKQMPRLTEYSDSLNQGYLPVPSLFIIDTDGTIIFEYISPNYKNRISTETLLGVLKSLKKELK